MTELAPDDAKIVTLARSARARTGAVAGAAVRDDIGRTYAAATVTLPSLRLTALQAAIAAAASSGATAFEAVAIVADGPALTDDERALLGDVGNPTVLLAGPDGRVVGG